jgi:DNA polymerase III epsilon subunit family exonuclease
MTGLDIDQDRVVEVAVVRGDGRQVIGELQSLVRADRPLSAKAAKVTRITPEMLTDQPEFPTIAPAVREMLRDAVVIAHNVPFDVGFIHQEMERAGVEFPPPVTVDTLLMARRLFAFRRNDLAALCEQLGIVLDGHHRALADARATFQLYHRMLEILDPDSTVTVAEVNDLIGALAPNSPLRLLQQKLLRDALRSKSSLFIEYQNTSSPEEGPLRREIGVWMLNLPYIQAWCYLRQGERIFRLDRIRSVLPGGREYDIPSFEPRI